ncbi:hypothetical protein ABPG75_009192 [Micractinium tetrahymenae]
MAALEALIDALQKAVQAFLAPGRHSQGIAPTLDALVTTAERAGELPPEDAKTGSATGLAADSPFAASMRSLLVQLGGALAELSPGLQGALAADSPAADAKVASEQMAEALSCIQTCGRLARVAHVCGSDAFRFAQCWRLITQCGRPLMAALLQAASERPAPRGRRSMQARLEGRGGVPGPLQAAAMLSASEQVAAAYAVLYAFNTTAAECSDCRRAHAAFAAATAGSVETALWLAAAIAGDTPQLQSAMAAALPGLLSFGLTSLRVEPDRAVPPELFSSLAYQVLQMASAPCLLGGLRQLLRGGSPTADSASVALLSSLAELAGAAMQLAPADERVELLRDMLTALQRAAASAEAGMLALAAEPDAPNAQRMLAWRALAAAHVAAAAEVLQRGSAALQDGPAEQLPALSEQVVDALARAPATAMAALEPLIDALQNAVQAFSAPGRPSQGIAARLRGRVAAAQRSGELPGGEDSEGEEEASAAAHFDADSPQAATLRSLVVQLSASIGALAAPLKALLAPGVPAREARAAAAQFAEALACIEPCRHVAEAAHICGPDALRFTQCWRLIVQCGLPVLTSALQAASGAPAPPGRRTQRGRAREAGQGRASHALQAAARTAAEQVSAAYELLAFLSSVVFHCANCHRAHAASAAAAASSTDALLWLAAASAALSLCSQKAQDKLTLWMWVLAKLLTEPDFARLQAAMAGALPDLLAIGFRTLAVGPAAGAPPEFVYSLAAQTLQVAGVPCLLGRWRQLLASGSTSAQEAVRALAGTVRLLRQHPGPALAYSPGEEGCAVRAWGLLCEAAAQLSTANSAAINALSVQLLPSLALLSEQEAQAIQLAAEEEQAELEGRLLNALQHTVLSANAGVLAVAAGPSSAQHMLQVVDCAEAAVRLALALDPRQQACSGAWLALAAAHIEAVAEVLQRGSAALQDGPAEQLPALSEQVVDALARACAIRVGTPSAGSTAWLACGPAAEEALCQALGRLLASSPAASCTSNSPSLPGEPQSPLHMIIYLHAAASCPPLAAALASSGLLGAVLETAAHSELSQHSTVRGLI